MYEVEKCVGGNLSIFTLIYSPLTHLLQPSVNLKKLKLYLFLEGDYFQNAEINASLSPL